MSRANPDRRTPVACGECGAIFLRTKNTQFCSALCRLLAKSEKAEGGCWNWTATLDRHGYGTFYLGRNQAAHRAAYELIVGPIPGGLHIDHLCRNRACINPAHMEPVTQRENTLRGAAPSAVALREGRCKNGHPRTQENTYVRSGAARQCRICMKASRAQREGSAA